MIFMRVEEGGKNPERMHKKTGHAGGQSATKEQKKERLFSFVSSSLWLTLAIEGIAEERLRVHR